MKRSNVFYTLLCLAFCSSQVPLHAGSLNKTDCAPLNQQFADIIREAQVAEEQARSGKISTVQSEQIWKTSTERANAVVDGAIRQQLTVDPQPAAVVEMIRCVELPYLIEWSKDVTNTPFVVADLDSSKPQYVVAFVIIRGNGEALSRLELWNNSRDGWSRLASAGDEFNDSSYSVYSVKTGNTKRSWFLMYGQRQGEAALKFELIENDGTTLKRLWLAPPLVHAKMMSIVGDRLVLRQFDRNDAKQKLTFYNITTYEIADTGLRPISSEVTSETWFPKDGRPSSD